MSCNMQPVSSPQSCRSDPSAGLYAVYSSVVQSHIFLSSKPSHIFLFTLAQRDSCTRSIRVGGAYRISGLHCAGVPPFHCAWTQLATPLSVAMHARVIMHKRAHGLIILNFLIRLVARYSCLYYPILP